MASPYKILAINPGSTSTKIAVFENDVPIFTEKITHTSADLSKFESVSEQFDFRKNIIVDELKKAKIDILQFDAVIGRGGILKPMASGVYAINELMKSDSLHCVYGEHASNLGALIADEIASAIPHAKAYIADPTVVDELCDVARVTGFSEIKRISIFHALNQKVIARKYAKSISRNYEDLNLIVAHLGGGISVGAHCKGRIIDVNNALNGEGPFSPERCGSIPALQLVNLCFSGKYTLQQIKKLIAGSGGMVALIGTNEAYEVEKMAAQGNAKAALIQEAMCYQIAKSIGAMATVLKGDVNAVILTGGIAHNKFLCKYVGDATAFIAPLLVYPGEDELAALASNALMALKNEVEVKTYK